MDIEPIIEARLAEAQRAAVEAREIVARLISFVSGDSSTAPSAAEVRTFALATGAKHAGRDDASRLLRAVAVRSAVASRHSVSAADLAVAVGLSRQYIWRRYGALVSPRCAAAEFARRYSCRSA